MSQSSASLRTHAWRWILALLTLGVTVAVLPAATASAAADGLVKGTVTFHETYPARTLEVYRQSDDGSWSADPSRAATIASTGRYRVHVPADEPVLLRVSFGSPDYSYFYGDAFTSEVATPLTVGPGQTVGGKNLSVPEPVLYSGRLVDRSGQPVSGAVTPTVNTDGASMPIVSAPLAVDSSGQFQVFLPARTGGVYESGVLGTSGDVWSWLGGGDGFEPNFYLNPHPGESHLAQVIELPLGTPAAAPDKTQPAATTLRAIRTPAVHGVVRKGRVLRSTTGTYNKRVTAVRFQWLRNGKVIHHATHRSYRLRKADVRKHIRVRVTAYSGSAKVRATSARTSAVRAR